MTTAPRRLMVFAGEFRRGSTEAGLAEGFERLGWTVARIVLAHGDRARRTLGKAFDRARAPLRAAAYNRAILGAVEGLRPDVFATVKGVSIGPATLGALRRTGALTLNYYPDFHFDHGGLNRESLFAYDLFVTTKSFQLDWLMERLGPERIGFVHHGYCPDVHRRVDGIGADGGFADIFYAGDHTPYKEAWLSAVAEAFPERRLVIAGERWARAARRPPLQHCVLGRRLTGEDYASAIGRSRITLAVHSGPAGPEGWSDLVSTRTFEIPACGGFMLHIDNPEVRALFEPGREIDVFSTRAELCERIGFYLDRPALRAVTATRAHARAVPAYSYDARAAEVAMLIEGRLAQHRTAAAEALPV